MERDVEPINIEAFWDRTGIDPRFTMPATKVVALRDLFHGSVTSIQVMPKDYLDKLIRNITLAGSHECKPYQSCDIRLTRVNPIDLVVGQTFVLRSKYQAFLDDTNDPLSASFCIPRGVTDRSAMIIFGCTSTGEAALAHYVPPIIEATNDKLVLLDGVHRNYSALQSGITIESVVLAGVDTHQPFEAMPWSVIQVVDEKPASEARFHKPKPEQFRNLKGVGING